MDVRFERPGDEFAIRAVHLAAFGDEGVKVVELVDSLRALIVDTSGMSLLVQVDGAVVGHVMLVPALLDAPRRLVDVHVLSPLGVAPHAQRSGVGSMLVKTALASSDAGRVPLVFLEGDPAYYSRFGFVTASGMGFRRPSLRTPDASFQVFRLGAYEDWMTGTLVYPDVFWKLDLVGLRDS